MSRNAESRFALNPTRIDLPRSTFGRDSSVKTSFNVGELVPFYCDAVYPGDTFQIRTNKVVRLQTLLTPMMDNVYLDSYYFFVPSRLVWSHWKEFMGENTQGAWAPTVEYEEPQLRAPADTGFSVGTLWDYFGLPTGVADLAVSALPFRAYSLIVNEFFRDQNLQDPVLIPMDDSATVGVNTGNYITDLAKGGKPFIAAKFHDYFTSCLPQAQKGEPVTIPVSSGANLPVITINETNPFIEQTVADSGTLPAMSWVNTNGLTPGENGRDSFAVGSIDGGTSIMVGGGGTPHGDGLLPANLWAVNDGMVSATTINQLRMAFQVQKLLERDAMGGSRYRELIKSHFGVTSPDARMQIPEYLGGNRVPININQVIQQSGTGSGSETPQGTTVGMSLTTDSNGDFIKSFTEHGYVIGVMVARYDHTYQQGIERFWSRKDRLDYYWPAFAHIGNQAVLNKEIFAQGTEEDDEVFGYQEAWADMRYKPSRVTGEMRSSYAQSLDVWHLADDYDSLPRLSSDWIMENKNNVDRVLAVTSEVSNQLFCDIFVQNKCTRALPLYSIPGLIDHY